MKYLPTLMDSPKVITERTTEQTVPMGLNIDTKTGPFFFIAHPLKLMQAPPTVPPCELESYRKKKLTNYRFKFAKIMFTK